MQVKQYGVSRWAFGLFPQTRQGFGRPVEELMRAAGSGFARGGG